MTATSETGAAASGRQVHLRTCPLCEAMCGLEIHVRDEQVELIRADRDDVWIHPADAALLAGPEAHLRSESDGSALMRALGREDLVPEREAILRRIVGRSAGVDRELQDGDTSECTHFNREHIVDDATPIGESAL